MRRLTVPLAALAIAVPSAAAAHAAGEHGAPWRPDPAAAALVVLVAIGYGIGFATLRGRSRAAGTADAATGALFAAGFAALAVALLSPLDQAADLLFAAHMVQHLILMMVAPALLVLGRSGIMLLWALPRPGRRIAGRALRAPMTARLRDLLLRPGVAAGIFVATFLVWHTPGIYRLARANEAIHAVEHLGFFAAGLLFWTAILRPPRAGDYGRRILAVVSTAIGTGMPAALLILAAAPLYGIDPADAARWGLTPLEDQQLAGLIMWIPMELAFLGVAAWLFAAWMGERAPAEPPRRHSRIATPGPVLSVLLLMILAGCSAAPAGTEDGPALIAKYGCGSCHVIPGIAGADGNVGPPLTRIGSRAYIAGMLPNRTDALVRWIRSPQSVVPGNVMPDMGISEDEGRRIAAYLQTLR